MAGPEYWRPRAESKGELFARFILVLAGGFTRKMNYDQKHAGFQEILKHFRFSQPMELFLQQHPMHSEGALLNFTSSVLFHPGRLYVPGSHLFPLFRTSGRKQKFFHFGPDTTLVEWLDVSTRTRKPANLPFKPTCSR